MKELFSLGPFAIHPFGLTLALGFFIGVLLITAEARRRGLKEGDVVDVALWVMVAGLLGARILYILANLDYYKFNLTEIWHISTGGLSFHGGLAAGLAMCIFLVNKRGWYLQDLLDAAVPGLALGYTVARIGCDVIGRPTNQPWGIPMGNDVLVHPQYIYASLANYFVFFVLWKWRHHSRYRGQLFNYYLILYGVSRFFIEFFRYGKPLGPFSLAQWGSLLLVGTGVYLHNRWQDMALRNLHWRRNAFTINEAFFWLLGLVGLWLVHLLRW